MHPTKLFIWIILAALISASSFAQTSKIGITGAYGTKSVHLGMHIDSIRSKPGNPSHVLSQTASIEFMKKSGFNPSLFLEFRTRFDSAYYYTSGSKTNVAPVYAFFNKREPSSLH